MESGKTHNHAADDIRRHFSMPNYKHTGNSNAGMLDSGRIVGNLGISARVEFWIAREAGLRRSQRERMTDQFRLANFFHFAAQAQAQQRLNHIRRAVAIAPRL